MDPRQSYRQQQSPAWTRIDLLLAQFDGAIERSEAALAALDRRDGKTAKPLLDRSFLIVAQLAAGIDLRCGELPIDLLRLYEFAGHCLRCGTPEKIESALRVLCTLREGMRGIRSEATELELAGVVPPAGAGHRMTAVA